MSEALDALRQPHAQLLLRLLLGGLLVIAAVTKLTDRAAFREAVAEYELLPRALERPFAALLPWAELALGALLLLGFATTAAAALAAPLFAAFAIAIGLNLARGRHFDCHCFGSVQSDPIGAPALLRSLLLVAAAVIVAAGASRFGALDAAVFGAGDLPSTAEIVPMVLLAALIIDVLILLPETLALRQAFRRRYATAITGPHHHATGSST